MMLSKSNVLLSVIDRIDEKFGNITALSLKVHFILIIFIFFVSVSVTRFRATD